MLHALSGDVSQAVLPLRRRRPSSEPQRIRVAHGKGEIELLVQVVDSETTDVELTGAHEDAPTGIHTVPLAGHPLPPSQESVTRDASPRGFVLGPGGRVGKYELKEKLGQGTFGLVFTARDVDLDRDVAIKVLNPSHQTNNDIFQRFLQEARATARIRHPGIVTVFDCGKVQTSIGEAAYLVLELLEGESLTSRLARSGKLAPATAVEVARQIAAALDAAHRAQVLHRDLKPDNVYLVPDPAVPSGERVKVLDFGLARIGTSRHTMMNTVFGTPRYMSPEQCRSAATLDHRSDIYSLGCILFELITGRTPFDGDLRQILHQHQQVTPPRARQLTPEISQALDDLIAQMLAKDPNARPQSMAELQATLQAHGAVSPGVAATMMPVGAEVVSLPYRADVDASGMMLVPPQHDPFAAPDTAHVRKKRRKGPFAVAAIAFCIAGVLTAIAARGTTKSADAAPLPAPTSSAAPVTK
jgi:serine/threonine-protein kinase